MREMPISCSDAKHLERINADEAKWRKRIEKAKTPAEFREICRRLHATLRMRERHSAQMAGRIAVMKGEIGVLRRSRDNHKLAIRVLALEVGRHGVDSRADDIAHLYDPKNVPF